MLLTSSARPAAPTLSTSMDAMKWLADVEVTKDLEKSLGLGLQWFCFLGFTKKAF